MSNSFETGPNDVIEADHDIENPGRGRMVGSGDNNADSDGGRPAGQRGATAESADNNNIRSDNRNTTADTSIEGLVANMANTFPNDARAVDDTVRVTNRQYSRDSGSFVEAVEDYTDNVDARNAARDDYRQGHPLGRIREASTADAAAAAAQTETHPSYSRESTGYSSETVPSTNHRFDQAPAPADAPAPAAGAPPTGSQGFSFSQPDTMPPR